MLLPIVTLRGHRLKFLSVLIKVVLIFNYAPNTNILDTMSEVKLNEVTVTQKWYDTSLALVCDV